MVRIRPFSLGYVRFDRDESAPLTEEEHALANMRGAHVLRTSTCPDCAGPLVTTLLKSVPVRDNGWHAYRCASAECHAAAGRWSYLFVPGAARRLASGAPLPLGGIKVRWRDGKSAWDLARDRMLEAEECPLCGTALRVKDGTCQYEPAGVVPTSYACPADGCHMEWLVHPQAVRAHIRSLARELAHVRLAAKALSDEHDMVVEVHARAAIAQFSDPPPASEVP